MARAAAAPSSAPDRSSLRILAVGSLLHEPADIHCATRRWLDQPVLAHTLARLARCARLAGIAVLCWDDQADACRAAIGDRPVTLLPHGRRQCLPLIESVAAAQRWADGWRGGLLGTIPQDRGFFPAGVLAVARAAGADGVLLVEPASALLDPALCDALVARAHERPGHDSYFTAAAPGLAGLLVMRPLLEILAAENAPPGRRLHYRPEAPQLDPIASDCCVQAPTRAARTLADFRLDSDRKIRWAQAVLDPTAGAEALALRADESPWRPPLPRELCVELTTRRATRPAWLCAPNAQRDLDLTGLPQLVARLARDADDLRLTLAGRGDPLLAPSLFPTVAQARDAGIGAIHVETDLLAPPDMILELARAADVVSVHLPALTPQTYAAVMGAQRFEEAQHNLARLIAARDQLGRGTPIVAPTFVKCRANFEEMERWYDLWLTAAGSAVIHGPDAFGNRPPAGVAVARMARTERLEPSLRVLADGSLTDELSRPLGRLGRTTVVGAWGRRAQFDSATGGPARELETPRREAA